MLMLTMMIIISSASAETMNETVSYYNAYSSELGLDSLPDQCSVKTDDGQTEYKYKISDTIDLIYVSAGSEITAVKVVCLSSDDYLDFLAVCCSGAFSVMKTEYDTSIAGDILFQLLNARTGKADKRVSYCGDYAYRISIVKDIAMMVFMKSR